MPISFVLLNSDLGSDISIINEIKEMLGEEDGIKYEVQGVYGIYDIVLKLTADSAERLRALITSKIRRIPKIQSTLTMMIIEEQESL